jgi:hypothetical protein
MQLKNRCIILQFFCEKDFAKVRWTCSCDTYFDAISTNQDGRILGHIRIRAKTQGIALSLGDKITLKQKSNKALPA